jgi:uncharacterized membrane protein YcaP (DUF421 family)
MLTLFVRAIILYALVFVVIRLTGKRQLSDLQPFDLVVTLLIADLASHPASNTGVPLVYGVVPILALFLVQQTVSWACLKSTKTRSLICGRTVVLISRGKVLENALRASRYTLGDLCEQLRGKDVFDISQVEYAILETDGELSVLKKGAFAQPGYLDLGLPAPVMGPPLILVQDGTVHSGALTAAGVDENWLKKQLASAGIISAGELLFAQLSAEGTLYMQLKERCGAHTASVETGLKRDGGARA